MKPYTYCSINDLHIWKKLVTTKTTGINFHIFSIFLVIFGEMALAYILQKKKI